MTSEIPVTQAREELADLINRVAYGHERIILTRHSKPVACIVPPEDLARLEERDDPAAISLASAETDPGGAATTGPFGRPAPMAPGSGPMPVAAQRQPPGHPRR